MKTKLVVTAVFAVVVSAAPAWSQAPGTPPPPPDLLFVADVEPDEESFEVRLAPGVPPPPGILLAQAGPGAPSGPFTEHAERMRGDLERMRGDAEQMRNDAERMRLKAEQKRVFKYFDADHSLYVAAGQVDDKVQGEIEEDLNIMGRLIENAIRDVAEDRSDHRAMGIKIRSLPFGNVGRSLQIDGYGALFEASVPFPLVQPPGEPRADKTKETTNSAWEDARRQLSHGPDGFGPDGPPMPPPDRVEYDAAKVEAFKNALIDALGNASHMRHLQAKDFVTVVVRSAEGGPRFVFSPGAGSGGGGGGGGSASGNPPSRPEPPVDGPGRRGPKPARPDGGAVVPGKGGDSSTMTIRVKKSDVDALAKGDLKPEDFRKRALVVVN